MIDGKTARVIGVAALFLGVTIPWLNQRLIKGTFSFETLGSLVYNPPLWVKFNSVIKNRCSKNSNHSSPEEITPH